MGDEPPLRAAPADLIASVMSPSRMFPGEGLKAKSELTALAAAAYVRISPEKRSASSSVVHRFTSSCSTPCSSGNSERIVVPPAPTTRSET